MWKGLFYFANFVFAFHSASGLFGESKKYLRSVRGAFSRSAEQGLPGLVRRGACMRAGVGAQVAGGCARAHCFCSKQGPHLAVRSQHVCVSWGS